MSDLTKYKGNFLEYADQEFSLKGDSRFEFEGPIAGLDIDVACNVGVFPSNDDSVKVEIDTDSPERFKVSLDQGYVHIKQDPPIKGNTGGAQIANIGTMKGRSIVMTNGQVMVDGVPLDQAGEKVDTYPHQVKIFCPPRLNLEARLDGCSTLASKVIFNEANVIVSGLSSIGLAAQSLELDINGQGESFAVMKGGPLDVSISGQGKVQVKGEYSKAKVSVSGMGNIFTEGVCLGDYSANVSGMGSITHKGTISGRVRESKSGMGSINI